MYIYKYIHSCVVVEDAGEKLLFDPGQFSFMEGRIDPELFNDVSTVIITHTHPDHVDVETLKGILSRSGACVLGNAAVESMLRREEIAVTVLEEGTRRIGGFTVRAIPARHEAILSDTLPPNTAFLVNERVLNPGDSFNKSLHAFKGVELLTLPVMAPWLTELDVARFAVTMAPREVLPVHDGYAKEFFLEQRYANYQSYFNERDIRFHPLTEPGARVAL